MQLLNRFLNNITMYRLVLYGLLVIIVTAFGLSIAGVLSYRPVSLAVSLVVIMAIGFISNWLLSHVFRSAPTRESWIISMLILFLILQPAKSIAHYEVLALGALLVTVSKYVLVFANRHIFNPVAIALLILGLLGSGQVVWWVGAKYLLPVVVIVGLLIVRKIRHFDLLLLFLVVALVTQLISFGISTETLKNLQIFITSGPLIFFATIMLTEPQTSPQTRKLRLAYAIVVGGLFAAQYQIGPFYPTPELALVVGNLFAFAIGSKRRHRLELVSAVDKGAGIHEFLFTSDRPLRFAPGQYMEWTLPHRHADSRGNRRYFTIASSPAEAYIRLVTKIDPNKMSSYKKALLALNPGDEIWVSQLSGDFTLPRNKHKKLVFIAGGVGVTPFCSFANHWLKTQENRDAILFYSSATADGFGYWELFNQAFTNGLQSNYHLTSDTIPDDWAGKRGLLNSSIIRDEVPDYKKRVYYLSGPNAMVTGYKKMLREAGVSSRHIKTDYFPGF